MLIIWSETSLGGAFITSDLAGAVLGDEANDLQGKKKASVSNSQQGLPLPWTLFLNVSILLSLCPRKGLNAMA